MLNFFILIPYFLDVLMDKEPDFKPTYTFYGRIDTLFVNTSTGHKVYLYGNAGVSFHVKCQPQITLDLTCYIPKNSIFYPPSNNLAHLVDNNGVFTPSALIYNEINFTIMYNRYGATYCHIEEENVANKPILSQIYQTIGDQLSIGIKTNKLEELKFYEKEILINGTCETSYRFIRNEKIVRNKYTLYSFIKNDDLRSHFNQYKTVYIKKDRRVNECSPLRDFIIGRVLWTDLIVEPVISKPEVSYSQLLFARTNFATRTINMFNLYEENKKVGYGRETIDINLISVT